VASFEGQGGSVEWTVVDCDMREVPGARLYSVFLVTTVWASAAAAAVAARAAIDPPSWGYLAAVLAASPLNALLLFLLVKAIRPASRSGSLSGRGWLN